MFETRNAVFRQGHFYDTRDNQRIELHEGTQVCLVAQEGGFRQLRPIGLKPEHYRSSEEMLAEVKHQHHFRKEWLLAKAGTILYFGLQNKKHVFAAQLLEDLYLYNCSHWKDETDLYLYDCACELTENTNRSLSVFEPVFGASLNDLYNKTYVHFLQHKGNASRNAVTVFYRKESLDPASKLEKEKNSIQKTFTRKLNALKKEMENYKNGLGL
ncbi:hypothetical protein ACFST9_01800 [Hymenobacter monticola]|uniref:Uncharacterized protein n=1 Tax=Hymenobacter monticola TaxID=1705399 RepID=A0ABY4B2E9_9BACT|nr:hypothetical protein [Hymenobacter monticola]UOE33304.1 hypothetical protein MTP16_19530 [Hymenobacter monticola]